MKKIMLLGCLTVLTTISINAQDSNVVKKKNSYLAFSGGPSFPIGDFADKSISNDQAGLAKTGFNLNLQYAYIPKSRLGIAANLIYSKYSIDASELGSEAKADHWQYWGILAGPIFDLANNPKLRFDLRATFGYANVNFPVFSAGTISTNEVSGGAFASLFGGNLRYNLKGNAFLFTNIDYTYMKPKVKYEGMDISNKVEVINLIFGMGFRF